MAAPVIAILPCRCEPQGNETSGGSSAAGDEPPGKPRGGVAPSDEIVETVNGIKERGRSGPVSISRFEPSEEEGLELRRTNLGQRPDSHRRDRSRHPRYRSPRSVPRVGRRWSVSTGWPASSEPHPGPCRLGLRSGRWGSRRRRPGWRTRRRRSGSLRHVHVPIGALDQGGGRLASALR